jgi:hypothetical protein
VHGKASDESKGSSAVLAVNADMQARVVVDTAAMSWQPSPSETVWRKRLHLLGEQESAQVTSIVRYDPGATFPAHDHPDGEEILVLEGVFSDEHGDWGVGSHLLNPQGFRHAPFSREGCVIFVKLQQYAGRGRRHQSVQSELLEWRRGDADGVRLRRLYQQHGFPESIDIESWHPGTSVSRDYPGGVEIFVIDGSLSDSGVGFGPGTWLRLPAETRITLLSTDGCTFYSQRGAIPSLLSSSKERGAG